ncbi:tetratricopeptide repeat protein [Nitrospinae bacterium]|nr:tetratricopeptide repeat protein [Nitrospinota bacterium]
MAENSFQEKKFFNGLFGVVLLTLFLLILTGQATAQSEIDKKYRQAKTLKEFELIAQEVQKILTHEPNQVEWQWRLARSHYSIAKRNKDTHQFDLCIEHSSRALEINPDSAISYFFRALCRGKQGEIKGIWSSLGIIESFEEDMKKALELDPNIQNGGPNRALGKLYLELPFFLGGSTSQAINHLKESVRLGPDHAENHLGLAEAYYSINNFTAARKSLSTLQRLTHNVVDDEDLLKLRTKGQELLNKMAYESQEP